MYCWSSALTVCQSRANSSATSLIVACRQRRLSKALGVERIVHQKLELFPFHLAATAALDPPHFQFEKYPSVPARQIAYAAHRPVVPAYVDATATAAGCFFEHRFSVITRAFGSPKMPCTVGCGRKPGKQYVSHSRRFRFAVRAIHH